MNKAEVFHIKQNMDVDGNGNTLVRCPQCENEIIVTFSNIADDSMSLAEFIECPVCNSILDQVHPSESLNKNIADHVTKQLLKGTELDIGNVFSKS